MPTPIKLKQGTNYYQPLCYFPIGYIYLSTSNVNPGQFFGGTWEPIKDRFLLLAGNTYKGGQTGGEATHKLTVDEMPSHNHVQYWNIYNPYGSGWYMAGLLGTNGGGLQTSNWSGNNPRNTGGDKPHNNMPPYIVVYGWVKVSN